MFFMRFVVENNLSTLHDVIGRVISDRIILLMFGKMSSGLLSSSSMSDGRRCQASAFRFSCCMNTVSSASPTSML